jgi:hypothetical protein
MAPPVPNPPYNEINNQTAWSTINSSPHLFCITTPIKVEHLGSLLASHPNQPLVESICWGLKEGFWPWAITDGINSPEIIDNASRQKLIRADHLQFVHE